MTDQDQHEARVKSLADDVRDMGQRVVGDEGRLGYATEKLGYALRYCARAMARCGVSLEHVLREARDAYEREHEAM
jgi:hypothetical protein